MEENYERCVYKRMESNAINNPTQTVAGEVEIRNFTPKAYLVCRYDGDAAFYGGGVSLGDKQNQRLFFSVDSAEKHRIKLQAIEPNENWIVEELFFGEITDE